MTKVDSILNVFSQGLQTHKVSCVRVLTIDLLSIITDTS